MIRQIPPRGCYCFLKPSKVPNLHPCSYCIEEGDLETKSLEAVRELKAELVQHTLVIGFEHLTTHEILKTLIPQGIEIPSSFETAGHIAHVNLREEHAPYKATIGSVILEKNPHIKTVINKVGTIDSAFRFFNMEVIAGDDNTIVEIQEGGCCFKFDYAKVYWNSRLQVEHHRLVEEFKAGELVYDMFCGVGPFALPAAKKGCIVYANDLNPESVHWLMANAKRNKIESKIHIYNQDAREFVRNAINETGSNAHVRHFIMNLPATAHEFLDIFPILTKDGSLTRDSRDKTIVHCYIFCKTDENPVTKINNGLGHPIEKDLARIRRVRDVAPNKEMFCISFYLPESIFTDSSKRPCVRTE